MKTSAVVRIVTGLSVLATTAMFATTMDIAFTPVGYETGTIAGVQGRYFSPLLFPGLAILHTRKIHHTIPTRLINGAVFLVLTVVLFGGIWEVLFKMQ